MTELTNILTMILDALLSIDRALFEKINVDWAPSFLDPFFSTITDLHRQPWIFFFIFPILTLWIYKARGAAVRWLLVLIVTVGLSDFISYRVIKSNIDRARPESSKVQYVLRTHLHSGQSFPSIHAANVFAAATILAAAFPQGSLFFMLFAFLVGYSRIYVGVHFPLDVLGGGVIGYGIGKLVLKGASRWLPKEGWREYYEEQP